MLEKFRSLVIYNNNGDYYIARGGYSFLILISNGKAFSVQVERPTPQEELIDALNDLADYFFLKGFDKFRIEIDKRKPLARALLAAGFTHDLEYLAKINKEIEVKKK